MSYSAAECGADFFSHHGAFCKTFGTANIIAFDTAQLCTDRRAVQQSDVAALFCTHRTARSESFRCPHHCPVRCTLQPAYQPAI